MQKNKIEKSLNANVKFVAEFYLGLTLAMHFWMLGELNIHENYIAETFRKCKNHEFRDYFSVQKRELS